MTQPRTIILHGVVALAGLAAAFVFALRMTAAPVPAAPTNDGEFSVDRAFDHVREMAREPHPVGSQANARVRGYLIDQLTKMELSPQEQTANVARRDGGIYTVHNLIARLPGGKTSGDRRAVMLAAHYDSVPGGPGAADDAAGVAGLLETARALRAGKTLLDRDVILLITDGEERGLLGARGLFEGIDGMALKPQIGMVMNFEARGTAGPSIMFETAPHNLSFIRHFAAASPYPIGNSLSYDVYRMLPNDTDFTVFRKAGLKGLNFAMIGNYFYYHTKNDSPENLDRGSLYHHGAAALALTRHFANLADGEMAELLADDQPNAVYFNVAPSILVRYPATWIWPLTVLQLLLTTTAIVWGLRRGHISGRGLGGAGMRMIYAFLLTPAAVFGLMAMFHPARTPAGFDMQLGAISAVAVVITVLAGLLFRRVVRAADLVAAGLIVLSLLSIPLNFIAPGGSFLMLWPALFGTAGFVAGGYLRRGSWLRMLVCVTAALPAVLLLVPMNKLVFIALTLAAAPMLVGLMVLTAWLLIAAIASALESDQPKISAELALV